MDRSPPRPGSLASSAPDPRASRPPQSAPFPAAAPRGPDDAQEAAAAAPALRALGLPRPASQPLRKRGHERRPHRLPGLLGQLHGRLHRAGQAHHRVRVGRRPGPPRGPLPGGHPCPPSPAEGEFGPVAVHRAWGSQNPSVSGLDKRSEVTGGDPHSPSSADSERLNTATHPRSLGPLAPLSSPGSRSAGRWLGCCSPRGALGPLPFPRLALTSECGHPHSQSLLKETAARVQS